MNPALFNQQLYDPPYANWVPLLLGTIDLGEIDIYWRCYLGFE